MRLLPRTVAQWPPAPPSRHHDRVSALVGWCGIFPALTVMVLLRRRVGYALLSPKVLIIGTLVLIYVPYFYNGHVYSVPFLLLGLVVLVAGLVQRYLSWRATVRGEPWHTWHLGISRLTFVPLNPYDVRRYVDPLLCFALGAFIAIYVTEGLGLWLEVSGGALLLLEKYAYDDWKRRTIANMDRLYEAGMHGQAAEHFAQGAGTGRADAIEVGVIPSGRTLHRLVRALRRQRSGRGE